MRSVNRANTSDQIYYTMENVAKEEAFFRRGVGEDFCLPYIENEKLSPAGSLFPFIQSKIHFSRAFIPRKLLWIFAGSKSAEKNRDSGKMHFSQIPNTPLRGGKDDDEPRGEKCKIPY